MFLIIEVSRVVVAEFDRGLWEQIVSLGVVVFLGFLVCFGSTL